MIRLLSIVGARPNFVKLAAICEALKGREEFSHVIIHTGQHSSNSMSGQIWRELELPEPIKAEIQKYTHNGLGGDSFRLGTMIRELAYRIICIGKPDPDCVLVYGDCDSTLAGALAANKLGLKVAHIEAGLRSFDRTMPEEINRILIDQLADFMFCSEQGAYDNLRTERRHFEYIGVVGNTMIDTLGRFRGRSTDGKNLGMPYAVLTLHRPSNVDDPLRMQEIFKQVSKIEHVDNVVFPVHPRTKKSWTDTHCGIWPFERILTREPMGYRDFVNLLNGAALVLTDSGGVQEEAAFLGVPCLTLRDTTERPATLIENGGTNKLVGCDAGRIVEAAREALSHGGRSALKLPVTWDGKAGRRIVSILAERLS